MFDISKEFNAELVAMEQFITIRDNQLMLRISVDMEVVKRIKDKDFRHFMSVAISPAVRNYLTDSSLTIELKYVASNYIMFASILSFLEQNEEIDDEDISIISNHVDLENKIEVLSNHFKEKYEVEDVSNYLDLSNKITPVIKYGFSIYGGYKSAMGDASINTNHVNTFKMMMGKEFIDKAYSDVKATDLSIVANKSENEVAPTSNNSGKKEGCYIATAIYHSYDCKEVFCLRRYRDYYLKKHLYGRLFIKIYYFFSPTFVKLFSKTKLFRKIFKPYLDKKVEKLIASGYETTPYND